MYKNGQRRPKQHADFSNSPIVNVAGKIPLRIRDILYKKADQLEISLSVLIGRAIMNELQCQNPFVESANPPDGFVLIQADVQKVKVYILKFPGLSFEHLLMLYEEMGITKNSFLACYGFLLDEGSLKIKRTAQGYYGVHFKERSPL